MNGLIIQFFVCFNGFPFHETPLRKIFPQAMLGFLYWMYLDTNRPRCGVWAVKGLLAWSTPHMLAT